MEVVGYVEFIEFRGRGPASRDRFNSRNSITVSTQQTVLINPTNPINSKNSMNPMNWSPC
jgi:hypothetical protein